MPSPEYQEANWQVAFIHARGHEDSREACKMAGEAVPGGHTKGTFYATPAESRTTGVILSHGTMSIQCHRFFVEEEDARAWGQAMAENWRQKFPGEPYQATLSKPLLGLQLFGPHDPELIASLAERIRKAFPEVRSELAHDPGKQPILRVSLDRLDDGQFFGFCQSLCDEVKPRDYVMLMAGDHLARGDQDRACEILASHHLDREQALRDAAHEHGRTKTPRI